MDSTDLTVADITDIEGMISEIQEKLEDAVEQQDSLAKIRAELPAGEANAFDTPSTGADPKELGVLGSRNRDKVDDMEKQRKNE